MSDYTYKRFTIYVYLSLSYPYVVYIYPRVMKLKKQSSKKKKRLFRNIFEHGITLKYIFLR